MCACWRCIMRRAIFARYRWLDVDRVLDIRPAASLRSGGAGLRYTCSIAGVLTYLFLEETKWFFELAK